MEFKKNKCPNCGANIIYDEKLHQHKCQYCNSTFVDKNREKKVDPRVELTPDDLKKMKDSASQYSNISKGGAIAIIVTTTLIFFFIFIVIISIM